MGPKVIVSGIELVKNETVHDLLQYLMDNGESIYRLELEEFIALLVSYVLVFYGINDEDFTKEVTERFYKVFVDLVKYLEMKEE